MVGFGKCGFRNRKFLFFKTERGMETSNKRGLESIDGDNIIEKLQYLSHYDIVIFIYIQ